MKIIQKILKNDSQEEKNISLNRNGAAKLLGVSINVIVYWKKNDIFLSEETEDSDDRLLSSLSEVESNTKKLIGYICELISKKQNV